jgi:hypothetical protein
LLPDIPTAILQTARHSTRMNTEKSKVAWRSSVSPPSQSLCSPGGLHRLFRFQCLTLYPDAFIPTSAGHY